MEAKNALTYATFMDEETIIRNEEVEYQNQIPIGIMDSHYSLELNFRLGNYEESRKQIETYFSYLETDRLMPEVLKHECMEILYLLINLHHMNKSPPNIVMISVTMNIPAPKPNAFFPLIGLSATIFPVCPLSMNWKFFLLNL